MKVGRGFRFCCLLWVLDQCRIGSGCRFHGVVSSTALTGMQNSEKSTTGVVVRSVQLHGLWLRVYVNFKVRDGINVCSVGICLLYGFKVSTSPIVRHGTRILIFRSFRTGGHACRGSGVEFMLQNSLWLGLGVHSLYLLELG